MQSLRGTEKNNSLNAQVLSKPSHMLICCSAIQHQYKKKLPLSKINRSMIQKQYASVEGLTMIHMEHAVSICDKIMHLCLIQAVNPGGQNQ